MSGFKDWVKLCLIKLRRFFDGRRPVDGEINEKGFSGLGQFVLLLAIVPFIADMTLYSLGETKPVPSLYETDPYRFDTLPAFPKAGKAPRRPRPPVGLNEQEKKLFNVCRTGGFVPFFTTRELCQHLSKKHDRYTRLKASYDQKKSAYDQSSKSYRKLVDQRKQTIRAYENFTPELANKPDHVEITPSQYSTRSIMSMLSSTVGRQGFQNTGLILWYLGAVLIIPAVWWSIRKRCWSLLICGLAIPSYHYLLSIFAWFPGLSEWVIGKQLNHAIVAQVAFLWFAVKGHILSKSFWLFILCLSILVTITSLFGGVGQTVFKSHLPIFVFVITAMIARFVVKGIKENAYLFVGKGWRHNFEKLCKAFLLWLPLLSLALPMMYFTTTFLPNTMIDSLHKNQILQFDSKHDFLDNSLQSTAIKTDEALFAWHLNIESIKVDIVQKSQKLLNDDLEKRVARLFDQVMPQQLVFDDYQSDKFLVGPAVELAVDASQDSTNKAFVKMRNQMKRNLTDLAMKHGQSLKNTVKENRGKAIEEVDKLHMQGIDVILNANKKTQASLWWGINYLRAVHLLLVLFFVFVCVKSFLYVFARVSFNRKTGTFITLGSLVATEHAAKQEENPQKLGISAQGSNYTLPEEITDIYYISRRFQCRGRAPSICWPQPGQAFFARLFNRALFMNKVEIVLDQDPVSCTATQGAEFFEWDVPAGETIVFDFGSFVGMSATVKLSTLISTRASSLLLGKMIYSQATGPGKLILMANGRAEVSGLNCQGGSLPPERMIAMQKDARFYVDSEVDLMNIYLSMAYVAPQSHDKVIVDVDNQNGNKAGLGSFVKRFMLPL